MALALAPPKKHLRVLFTNNTLAHRGGAELYVRDVAVALRTLGHDPVAFSMVAGDVAAELEQAGIEVVTDPAKLSRPPDIIHGHHHVETMMALLHFPGVPAISFCHGAEPWEEGLPQFPRIYRYVAVSEACRERVLREVPAGEARVSLLLNFVDLDRFRPRDPLPARPTRALVFSNHATERGLIPVARQACARTGLALDVVGLRAGHPVQEPERRLGNYDLVFAAGRSALEAMAVGAAVVLCGEAKAGPLVTTANFTRLRPLNFGFRAIREPLEVEILTREIERYDAADAARVSSRVRAEGGLEQAVPRLLELYDEILREHAERVTRPDDELRAASAYLSRVGSRLKEASHWAAEWTHLSHERDALLRKSSMLERQRSEYEAQLAVLLGSRTWRLRRAVLRLPGIASACGWLSRLASRSAGDADALLRRV